MSFWKRDRLPSLTISEAIEVLELLGCWISRDAEIGAVIARHPTSPHVPLILPDAGPRSTELKVPGSMLSHLVSEAESQGCFEQTEFLRAADRVLEVSKLVEETKSAMAEGVSLRGQGRHAEARSAFFRARDAFLVLEGKKTGKGLLGIVEYQVEMLDLALAVRDWGQAARRGLAAQYILTTRFPELLRSGLASRLTSLLDQALEQTGQDPLDPAYLMALAPYDSWLNDSPVLNRVLESADTDPGPPSEVLAGLPIAVLTGAGASIPLGFPSMQSLLASARDRIAEVPADCIDFEDFLFRLLVSRQDEMRQRGNGRISSKRPSADGILNEAKDLVHDLCGVAPDPRACRDLYSPLLDLVLGFQPHLPIFTLNYDRAIETFSREAGYRLLSGFPCTRRAAETAADLSWQPSEFSELGVDSPTSVLLFKLHGSTTWRHNFLVEEYVHLDDELPRLMPGYGDFVIYPLQPKVSFLNPVLEELDRFFVSSLEGLSVLLTIGYSFRDPHLRKKLRLAKRKNKKLSVFVIDPQASEVGGNLSSLGFRRGVDLLLFEEKFSPGLDLRALLGAPLEEALAK